MDFFQQAHAGRLVEVVQKIGQQHGIVRPVEIHIESAAGQHRIAFVNTGLASIVQSHAQHRCPIQARDVCLQVLPRNFNSEQAVTSSDIQHAHRTRVSFQHNRAQRACHGSHHRRHGFRKLHPNRVLRLHASIARQNGTASAHNFRQVVVRASHLSVAKKFCNRGQARWRARVE